MPVRLSCDGATVDHEVGTGDPRVCGLTKKATASATSGLAHTTEREVHVRRHILVEMVPSDSQCSNRRRAWQDRFIAEAIGGVESQVIRPMSWSGGSPPRTFYSSDP